ncbi:hypothetical protein V1511DRAFT_485342 [Dipodascopsis uninucleata]
MDTRYPAEETSKSSDSVVGIPQADGPSRNGLTSHGAITGDIISTRLPSIQTLLSTTESTINQRSSGSREQTSSHSQSRTSEEHSPSQHPQQQLEEQVSHHRTRTQSQSQSNNHRHKRQRQSSQNDASPKERQAHEQQNQKETKQIQPTPQQPTPQAPPLLQNASSESQSKSPSTSFRMAMPRGRLSASINPQQVSVYQMHHPHKHQEQQAKVSQPPSQQQQHPVRKSPQQLHQHQQSTGVTRAAPPPPIGVAGVPMGSQQMYYTPVPPPYYYQMSSYAGIPQVHGSSNMSTPVPSGYPAFAPVPMLIYQSHVTGATLGPDGNAYTLNHTSPGMGVVPPPPLHLKPKRRRASQQQVNRLNEVFRDCIFPSTERRLELSRELGMTPRTVQIWFQNRRQGWRAERRRQNEHATPLSGRSDDQHNLEEDDISPSEHEGDYGYSEQPDPEKAP